MKVRKISLDEITGIIKTEYLGSNIEINGLNLSNKPTLNDSIITYVTSAKYLRFIKDNKFVKALFIDDEVFNISKDFIRDIACFIVKYPEESFYKLHHYLLDNTDFYNEFDFDSLIGSNPNIKDSAVIERGVKIGDNVSIGYNTIIKKGTVIGNNVIIGSNSIIGSEGFQLIEKHNKENMLIRHAGGCTIADHVFIGDNSTIGNSLFESTTSIGMNTKIGNHVHVAHNCIIGSNCVLTAGVVLSGSTVIKNNVWVAPNSTISNKVTLNEGSFIGIGSVVIKSVEEKNKVFGNPAKLI